MSIQDSITVEEAHLTGHIPALSATARHLTSLRYGIFQGSSSGANSILSLQACQRSKVCLTIWGYSVTCHLFRVYCFSPVSITSYMAFVECVHLSADTREEISKARLLRPCVHVS